MKKIILVSLSLLAFAISSNAQIFKSTPSDSSKVPLSHSRYFYIENLGKFMLADSTVYTLWHNNSGKGKEIFPKYNNFYNLDEDFDEFFDTYTNIIDKTNNPFRLNLAGVFYDFKQIPTINKSQIYAGNSITDSIVNTFNNGNVISTTINNDFYGEYSYDLNGNILTQKTLDFNNTIILDSAVYNTNNERIEHYRISDNGDYVTKSNFTYNSSGKIIVLKNESYYQNVLESTLIDSLFEIGNIKDSVVTYYSDNTNPLQLEMIYIYYKTNDYIDSIYGYDANGILEEKIIAQRNSNNLLSTLDIYFENVIYGKLETTYTSSNRIKDIIIHELDENDILKPYIKIEHEYDSKDYLIQKTNYNTFENNVWSYGEESLQTKFYYKDDNDTTTSIKENLIDKSITIYPNPASNTIKVSSEDAIKFIYLYDLNGRKLKSYVYNNSIKEVELDIYNLATGIYQLEVITSSGSSLKKLVKE